MATKKKVAKSADKTAKKTARKAARAYVIARCDNAGLIAGYVAKETREYTYLSEAIRLWEWDGAAGAEELSVYGPNPAKIAGCKFTVPVKMERLLNADICQLLECHDDARVAIQTVPSWRA